MNTRPPGYEPDELPNCSIPRYNALKSFIIITQLHIAVKGVSADFLRVVPRIPDNLPDAQQCKRDGTEDHPDAHAFPSGQVRIERAGAAEQEDADEPCAL